MATPATLDSIATPALLVDHPTLVRNVGNMADRARRAGVALRPHLKTHKTAEIAALQRERGAAGLTVATIHEAELAATESDDVLVAYPPVGSLRLDALIQLAERVQTTVVVDDVEQLAALSCAGRSRGVRVGYLWEVDCGALRTGTPAGDRTADVVAAAVARFPDLPFRGLLTFAGHVYRARDVRGIAEVAREEEAAVRETAAALLARGVETPTVSFGTTPTAHHVERGSAGREIRPGNYVFYDATQVALGVASLADCALSVLATVVSRPDPRTLILDAGSKALSADRMSALTLGFGVIPEYPGLVIEQLYEEHAIVRSAEPCSLPLGARVRVVPNHACTTVNLHSRMAVVVDEELVDLWEVAAREWGTQRPAWSP